MKNLFTVAMLSTVVLASCSKDKTYIEPAQANTASIAQENESIGADEAYRADQLNTSLSATTDGEGNVRFNNGYMHAQEVQFEGVLTRPNTPVQAMVTKQDINIYYPDLADNIKIPAGQYNTGILKMRLEPIDGSSLFLRGSFVDIRGKQVEVRLVIQEPVNIQVRAEREFSVANDIRYLQQLPAAMSQYVKRVDINLWDKATSKDDVIEVSATSNIEIYKAFLESLKETATVMF